MSRQTMGKVMTRATNKATAPRAAALARCAFACALALSLALPAEGLTYAFAAPAAVDAPAAPAAVSAAPAAPAAGEDASAAAAEGETAAEDSEGEGSGSAGPEGAGAEGATDGSEGGAEDPGTSDGSGAPGGEGQTEPDEGAQDGVDDSIVMEAPEAEAPEDAEGAAPIADAPEPRAGGTYVVTRTAGGASIGSFATLAAAVAACPSGTACTVTLTGADDTAMGDQVTVAAGQDITLTSDTGTRQIIQTGAEGNFSGHSPNNTCAHFIVRGKLTLKGVELTTALSGIDLKKNSSRKRSGGVLCMGGTLVMEAGSVISDCIGSTFVASGMSLEGGGGVAVVKNGRFVMNGGSITGCSTGSSSSSSNFGYTGGGVLVRSSEFEMNGGSIVGNYSFTAGGGVGLSVDNGSAPKEALVTINGGRIADNESLLGGGIGIGDNVGRLGKVVMRGGAIEDNLAGSLTGGTRYGAGGGVRAYNFNMSGGSITNNRASYDGGGLCTAQTNSAYYRPVMDASLFTSSPYEFIRVNGSAVISGNRAGSTSTLPGSHTACDPYVPGVLFDNDNISYRRTPYNVTFSANNGAVPAQPDFTKACDYPHSDRPDGFVVPSLGAMGFTAPLHKHLKGWNTRPDGTGSAVAGVLPFYRDATIYAIWASDAATVVYDAQGGTPTTTTVSNVAVDGPIGTPPTVTKTGSVLLGWYTQPTGGTKVGSADTLLGLNPSIQHGDTVTLYARWGDPVCQVIRPGASGVERVSEFFGSLEDALADAQAGDRVELLKDVGLTRTASCAWASGTVKLTTAPASQPVAGALPWQGPAPAAGEAPRAVVEVANAAAARIDLSVGGGLEVGRVAIEGASGAPALATLFVLDRSSSLAFGDGAEVRGFSNQLATLANSSGAAAGCTVSFAPGCSIHDVGTASPSGYLIGFGGVVYAGPGANARIEVTGGEFYDCATGIGGVFFVEAGSEIEVTGGEFHGNEAGMGGVIRSSGGSLRLLGGEFHGNKAVIHGTGAPAGAGGAVLASGGSVELGGSLYVHDNELPSSAGYLQQGAGLIVYAGTALKVSGAPRVTGNSVVDSSTGAVLGASNLVTGASVDVTGLLAPTASVGVTAPSGSDLAGQQFGAYVSGASANLDRFTNDLDPALVGADGGSGKVVWRMGLVDASFTKVGASQEPGAAHGLYAGLSGAEFNVYEYVGTTPLSQAALDAGTVGPATTASADWAPLLDANGTVGTAGNASNVPHGFVSGSNGKVDVKKVKPNSWYMLVETQAPSGYQLPQGQWAFQVSDPDGDGTFDIDTGNVLACKGQPGGGGSLPPAMATSVNTSSGTRTGVFVVNTPEFGLPHAGATPELPLAGAALVGMAWALHRLRGRSRRA